jgi:Ca2+-binding RTX toxin-like protein
MAKSIPTPNNDRLIGTASNDTIDGLAGNDTITGVAGNDSLRGNIGADSIDGGVGNDLLFGDAGNDTLIGAAGNDVLDGGADNDRLDGGAGADTLIGGTGIDTLIGGDHNDFYIVDHSQDVITEKSGSKAGLDSVQSSVNYTLPANVENLTLTGLADLKGTGSDDRNVLTGNDGSNLLDGKNGNDTLKGGDGDDTLLGGGGVDQLIGGAGSDTYQISSNEDKIIETATDDGDDVVESSVSYTLGANLETLTLTGTDAINGTGNELANIIEGNPGDNRLQGEEGDDTLQGGAGNDTLRGGAGDDIIEGGDGTDQVVYLGQEDDYKITYDADSDSWIVADINGTEGDGTDEGRDELSGIESLFFTDKGVVTLNPVTEPDTTDGSNSDPLCQNA